MNNVVVFAALCGLMLAAALVWALRPLFARPKVENQQSDRPYSVMAFVSACVIVLSTGLYLHASRWPWTDAAATSTASAAAAVAADIQAEVTAYQARVNANPQDLEGWLMLGNALVRASSYSQAQNAFQRAVELSGGQSIDAKAGLIEVLVLADPSSANGRAAALVEEVLRQAPNHPKALWYGGLVALQNNNPGLARGRFNALLALDPPENIRAILQAQVERLDQQLTQQSGQQAGQPAIAGGSRKILVKVTLAASLKAKVTQPMALFVLARRPNQPGPPLAVERHQSGELPLQVELTRDDAMLPSMSLLSADDVEVVARLSASGTPTEQPGDLYGLAHYSFSKQGNEGSVTIEINRQAP